jgi:hypothetical protein
MTDLDEMTKAELLEHARELGVTPANNDMTKDELRTAIDEYQGEEPDAGGQATTTASKDFLGRSLITPAVNSKDYLGRSTSSALDYLGRTLVM